MRACVRACVCVCVCVLSDDVRATACTRPAVGTIVHMGAGGSGQTGAVMESDPA